MKHIGENCRCCGTRSLLLFHEVKEVPVDACRLVPDRRDALTAECGQLSLSFCETCGFIQNTAFDASRLVYGQGYEDSQAFSPRFRSFATALAKRLIETYSLRGRDIVEIGCGKGDFLSLLCELGGNRGVGIDPACDPTRVATGGSVSIQFLPEIYTAQHASLPADLICCRHTLEHLPEPRALIERVRDPLEAQPDSVLFFEVPDVKRVLEELAFWDFYYEHCSYFSLGSLARLFRSCGLEILGLTADFGDQYLLIEARAAREAAPREVVGGVLGEDDLERLTSLVRRFAERVPAAREAWRNRLDELQRQQARAVLWGAGSKAVGFLATLGVRDEIDFVVDINPHKQGAYLSGTGQQIVAPGFLKDHRPDLVIVTNPIYLDEIKQDLRGMGLAPEVIAL